MVEGGLAAVKILGALQDVVCIAAWQEEGGSYYGTKAAVVAGVGGRDEMDAE